MRLCDLKSAYVVAGKSAGTAAREPNKATFRLSVGEQGVSVWLQTAIGTSVGAFAKVAIARSWLLIRRWDRLHLVAADFGFWRGVEEEA